MSRMQRPGVALLGVRVWEVGQSWVPVVLASLVKPPEYLQTPWMIFVVVFAIVSLYRLFFDWLTIRYRIDDDGIVYESGWPTRVRSQVGWREINAVRVDQDLAHRVLGRYKATIAVGAEQRESIVIAALAKQEADLLLRLHGQSTTTTRPDGLPASPEPDAQTPRPATPQSQPVYRVSWRDHVVIAFTYGHFVLVVPFLVGGYRQVAEWIDVPSEDSIAAWLMAWLPVTIAALVLCAFLYGLAQSWVRFGGYLVSLVDGSYEVRFGVFERSTRRAQLDSVLGVRIDQNPLMVLLGMASLRLVLSNSHGEDQVLTILPVAKMPTVEEHVRRILPGASVTTDRPAWPAPVAVLVFGSGAGVLLLVAGQHWVVALLPVIVACWLANRWAAAWGSAKNCIAFRRGVCVVRRYFLLPQALRSLKTRALRSGPVLLAMVILDESPTTLLAPGVTRERTAELERVMLTRRTAGSAATSPG